MYEIASYSEETGLERHGRKAEWADVVKEVLWLLGSFGDEPGFVVYVEPCGLPWFCDELEIRSAAELPQSAPW